MQASADEVNNFKTLYTPTHLNIGNYILGVVAGIYFHSKKKSGEQIVVKTVSPL